MGVFAQSAPDPVAIVRDVLSVPDNQLDYGRAKLAFDRIPPALRRRYMMVAQGNQRAFQAAEALGWAPSRQAD